MVPGATLSAAANLFYGAATLGRVAEAAEAVLQTPAPELQPFGEGLQTVDIAAGARFFAAGTPQDRATIVSARKPNSLRTITGMIAASDGSTAHLFQTPREMLEQVRSRIRQVQRIHGSHSPARHFLPPALRPTEKNLRRILPPEEKLQSLMNTFVTEVLAQYSLEEALEIFINEYLLMQYHIGQASTDFGYDYLVGMQKILKQTVAKILRSQITETTSTCLKWLASTDKDDPKALAAVSFLAAFGETALESLKRAWEVARKSEEARSNALAGRLLGIFAEIGWGSLPVLREMKNLYPDNADFFDIAIGDITSGNAE